MTSKPKRFQTTLPHNVVVRGSTPPEDLLHPEDEGKVVAILLPLARRDHLLDILLAGVKQASSQRQPVILVDGGFHESCLPANLRAGAQEGVADALLFGASKTRTLVDASGDGSWGFVSAGTPLPDPERGWTHAAWPDFFERMMPEKGTLVLLLPAEFTGARVLARQADRQVAWVAGVSRSPARRIALLLLVLLVSFIAGVAWATGWLTPLGISAPDTIPPSLEGFLRAFPRPVAMP